MLRILDLHLSGGMWKGHVILEPTEHAEMHRVQYESAITAAEKNKIPPSHEPYGLGWLIKRTLNNHWFGLGSLTSAKTFGHAGVDTIMAVADPQRSLAIAFFTTDSPKPSGENTTRIRNTITDLVVEDVG